MPNAATTKEALEPCPWCNQPPKLIKIEGSLTNPELVSCRTDHCPMTLAMTPREWNARVSAPIAPVVDDHEDIAWERQTTINAIAYEFMKLFGATVKDGWTHDEMQPLFDAAREIITRTFPVLTELYAAAPAATVAPQQSTHHKHCPSWTVNTSGERQLCDCVCECTHSMFQHIGPGEHYWYEDCAVDGCPCMKFTVSASPAAIRDEAETTTQVFATADEFLDAYNAAATANLLNEIDKTVRQLLRPNRTATDIEFAVEYIVSRVVALRRLLPPTTTPPSTLARKAAAEIQCAHCSGPITEGVLPETWVHTKTGLATCRRSKSSNHDGIFRAEPVTIRLKAEMAATEICDYCGVDANDAEKIAAIIERCFAAESEKR